MTRRMGGEGVRRGRKEEKKGEDRGTEQRAVEGRSAARRGEGDRKDGWTEGSEGGRGGSRAPAGQPDVSSRG